jgi:hypothetical protein
LINSFDLELYEKETGSSGTILKYTGIEGKIPNSELKLSLASKLSSFLLKSLANTFCFK